jgi:hypothetical protein
MGAGKVKKLIDKGKGLARQAALEPVDFVEVGRQAR